MNLFDLVATIRINLNEFEQGIERARAQAKDFSSNLESAYSGIKDVLSPAVQGYQAVESVGKKAGDVIKKGMAGFATAATAVGGFGAAAVNAGMSFDSTMSQVSAISGATGDDFDALRDKALEMGAKTKFSASEAGEAMTYMGMAGWKAGDMISGIEGIMNLAAASGEDLATTSDIVTDALTAFGKQADYSGEFANILAATATSANTNVGMMGETFKYVAPVAGALGYEVSDTAEAIGLMANAGIKSTQAGTSLRSILTRLSTDAGASSKSLGALGTLTEKLGVEFYNTDGSARSLNAVLTESRTAWQGLTEEQQISYAKTIAGQEAMSGWLALMNAAPADIEKLSTAIAEANDGMGAAAEMAATMVDNLQGDLTLLGSAFESLQIAISDSLTPTLREFAQFGQRAMAELLEGFQEGGTEGFFSALTGIVTEAVTFLSEKAPQFATVSAQFIESLATGILNARDKIVDSANQIFTILVAGLDSWLSAHVSDLVDFGKQIVESLFQGVVSAGDIISKYIGDFIPLIAEAFAKYHEALFTVGVDILGAIGRGIVENKDKIHDTAKQTIANMVTALRDNAPDMIEGAVALLDALVDAIIDNLPLILEAGAEIVTQLVAGISGNIPAITVVVGAMTMELLKIVKVAGDIGAAFKNVSGIVSNFGGAFEKVKSIVGNGITSILGLGGKLMAGIQSLWALMLANPITIVIAAIGALVAAFVLLWNNCEAFRDFWIAVWETCKEVFSAFCEWASSAISAISDLFKSLGEWLKNTFAPIGEFIGNAFKAGWEILKSVWSAATGFFSGIWNTISGLFENVADWFGDRFKAAWDSITSAWGSVKEFFAEKWEDIKKPFSDALSAFEDIGKNILTGLWNGIKSKYEWVKSKVSDVVNGIKGVFTGKTGFDVHSPSRWAKKIFEYVMQGGVQGLQSGSEDLLRKIDSVISDAKYAMQLDPLSVDSEDGNFSEILAEELESAREIIILFFEFCRTAIIEFNEWYSEQLETFYTQFTVLLETAQAKISAVRKSFQTMWESITETWSAAPEWFAEICESIRLTFETLTAALTELFTAAAASIQETFASLQEAFQLVCNALNQIWEECNTFFKEHFEESAEIIKETWKTVGEFFAELWEAIKAVFEEAPEWFGETFTAALEAVQESWEPAVPFFTETWEEIISVFADAYDRFYEIGVNAMTGLQDGIESMMNSLIEAMKAVYQAMIDVFSDLTEELRRIGTEAMTALGEVVYTEIDNMKSKVEELISKIAEALKKLESAKAKTKALEEKAKKAEEAAEKKEAALLELKDKASKKAKDTAKAAEETAQKTEKTEETAKKVVDTAKNIFENIQTVVTGKTPTQIQREEKASYGKTSQKTPSQVNREDKEKTTSKKTNPNGYVSTSSLRDTKKNPNGYVSTAALRDTKKANPNGYVSVADLNQSSITASSKLSQLDKIISQGLQVAASKNKGFGGGGASGTGAGRSTGNVNVTIHSPKAMDETEAARQFKKVFQRYMKYV